ncbi:uncharacterized protein LOC114738779 [Neltuma alba]|uniref:uncharacterized protein LOC114738779 n=1 Tax=Neltuma alba TaxID=207710 RepID=UPI0010A3CE0F|nr:uncharacterized protein LOC114738779 [Prosopis alba]
MGSSLSHIAPHRRRDFVLIRCGQYEWSSEFGKESAIIYTREWDEKPGICTSYYRASHDKVLFTFYDAMSEDNLVAINIEFLALRDGDRLYKFGSVKARQFGENFTVKRRRPIGRQISFWSYEMGRSENQLALCRRDEEYEIQFEAKSPLVVLRNFLCISCDPSKGLVVDRLGFADPVE